MKYLFNHLRKDIAYTLLKIANQIKPKDGAYWFGNEIIAMQTYGDTLVVATKNELYQTKGDGKFQLISKED